MTIFSPELITLNMAAQDKQQVLALMAKTMDAAGRLQPNGYDNYLIKLKIESVIFQLQWATALPSPMAKRMQLRCPLSLLHV